MKDIMNFVNYFLYTVINTKSNVDRKTLLQYGIPEKLSYGDLGH